MSRSGLDFGWARRSIELVVAILAVGAVADFPARAGSLRGGVAAGSITSEAPTVLVNDPLFAKALVVDDGQTRIVIVCLDVGGASTSLVSAIRKRLGEELGIAEANVLVNASHNHHVQGQTVKDLPGRIVQIVRLATESMVPVKVGCGSGQEGRIMMNRRLQLKAGGSWAVRRANPSPKDFEVARIGPADPEIGILRLDNRDTGRPLAVLYDFAGHAYGGVPNGGVTADFPGFASAVLEEALGVTALFVQGAAGDVTPIRYKDVDAPPPTEQLGTMLGMSTLKAVNRIQTSEQGVVKMVSETLDLPRRQDIEARLESLQAQEEEILQFFTGVGCGTHGAGTFLNLKTFLPLYLKHTVDPDHPAYSSYLYMHEDSTGQSGLLELDAQNRQRVEKYLECIYQMEKLIRVRSNLRIFQRHKEENADGPITAEIQGIRIGDFVLVTFPGELFAEVGLRIKERSPMTHTFVAGYSNGHLGYAPTAQAYQGEAYEDSLTPFAPQWQEIYEARVAKIIERLAADR